MDEAKRISKEDLDVYRQIRKRAQDAEKEEEIARLRIFVLYGLRPNQTFSLVDGKIVSYESRQNPARAIPTVAPEETKEEHPVAPASADAILQANEIMRGDDQSEVDKQDAIGSSE